MIRGDCVSERGGSYGPVGFSSDDECGEDCFGSRISRDIQEALEEP